ncbi:flagellar hook-length control protein FliK [Thiocystis violascens]|uniref:Flagellar hook-length control protein n=1 Tax=Thiocystis violascens (strain ATCC 17096 / DSM 198 / 6111) TaxID=765911 RepID=I3Y614_THIV6|nr:flagellar hook-length control protein FliK [Thiocystis violascens]AFL72432.1 flagellar hook-length control protein [Thiocystis violascens DSM 198]
MIQFNLCTDLLSQVYAGASGETVSLETPEDGGFMGALGTQLQNILVEWGEDPAEIAALDGPSLLAQFLALAQDRLPPADEPRMTAQPPASLRAAASSPPEMPTDLLNKLLESSIAGASPASAQGAATLSEMRSEGAGQSESPTAMPADPLRRLVQPTLADGVDLPPTAAAFARSLESEETAASTAIPADPLRRLVQPTLADGVDLPLATAALARSLESEETVASTAMPADPLRRLVQPTLADGVDLPPTAAALARSLESENTAPSTAMPADPLRRLVQPTLADGVESADPTVAALATPMESGKTGPPTAVPADLLRRLLQPTPADGVESAGPRAADLVNPLESEETAPLTAIPADLPQRYLQPMPGDGVATSKPATAAALVKSGEIVPASLPQAFPAEALRQWLPSIPADDVAAIPTTAALADSGESGQASILKATAPIWLNQFPPGARDTEIGAAQSGNPLAGEGQGLPMVFSTRGALLDLALKATHETERLAVRGASDEAAELPETGLPATSVTSVGTQSGSGPARIFDLSNVLRPGGETGLAEQVKWVMRSGLGTAELTLHPRSLGAMEVRVTMEADQAHVQFLSPHPIVREVLEAALPRLRDALAQDGLSLGNVSISEQAPERRGEQDRERAGSAQNRQDFDGSVGDGVESPDLAGSTLSALAGRLDYFI